MDLHVVCCTLVLLTCTGVCFGRELILPEGINKAVGENVVIIPISIPESPYKYIKWSFNTDTILSGHPGSITPGPQYTNRVHINTGTLALTLRTLTESDTGPYTLSVETASLKTFTNVTSLQVLDKGTASGNGDSLSAGAVAGIVIGVLLGLAGTAGLIFYFMKAKEMPKTKSSGNLQNKATHNAQQQDSHYVNMTMSRTDTQMGHTAQPDDEPIYEN